jgi:hypothetical protein
MSGFMGSGKPNSFCNYFVEPHIPASRWLVAERMRQPRMTTVPNIVGSQDFILGAGGWFWHSRDMQMVVICETPRVARMTCWSGSSPAGNISIQVTVTLSIWVTACRFYHLVVCLVYWWWLEDEDGYSYIIMMITVFTLPMTLTSVNVLLVYACYSL